MKVLLALLVAALVAGCASRSEAEQRLGCELRGSGDGPTYTASTVEAAVGEYVAAQGNGGSGWRSERLGVGSSTWLIFSPDGGYGTVRVWETATGYEVATDKFC